MPGEDRVRPDDDEILAPPSKSLKNQTPEGAVPRHQGRTGWLRPEENAKLMAEGRVLGDEGRPGTEKGAEDSESEPNEPGRDARMRSGGGR